MACCCGVWRAYDKGDATIIKVTWVKGKYFLWGLSFLISGFLCLLVLFQWQRMCSIKRRSIKNVVDKGKVQKQMELQVRDRRVAQGEVVPLEQIARATDERGNDISNKITFLCNGNILNSKVFPTNKAGVFRVTVSVFSPLSEKKIYKAVQVLVDGRIK